MESIPYRYLGKLLYFVFPFLTSVTLVFTLFQQKIVHMYSFKPFHVYYLYKIILFCQVPISPIESQASSLLKYKAIYVDGTPDH